MFGDLESMPLDEQLAVRSARDRLLREFSDRLDTETIDVVLDASWEHLDAVARLKAHIPLLTRVSADLERSPATAARSARTSSCTPRSTPASTASSVPAATSLKFRWSSSR